MPAFLRNIHGWVSSTLALVLVSTTAAHAQGTFPSRTLRIVVPTAAGAGSDISARFYGEQLGKLFGQPVVIDNKPGANGVIAAMAVKMAPPDGYTIFLGTNTHLAVNPVLMKDLPYNVERDFKPLIGLSRGMMVFVTGENSPYKSIEDVVRASKKGAGRALNAGSYTGGFQLSVAWFADTTATDQVYVAYKGIGEVVTGLMGDQLDWGVSDLVATLPQIKAGKLRALAVAGNSRHQDLPQVPTVKESGFPAFVNYTWGALYVRAETPDAVTTRLVDAMRQVMALPATEEFVRKFGQETMPLSPEQMKAFQGTEAARFQEVARKAGITPQ